MEGRKVFFLPVACHKNGCGAKVRLTVERNGIPKGMHRRFLRIECTKGHIQYYDEINHEIFDELPEKTPINYLKKFPSFRSEYESNKLCSKNKQGGGKK